MRLVTPRKSLLVFLPTPHKMQFSLHSLYTSFQIARSMSLLTIHHLFRPSPCLPQLATVGITCAQPTMFPTLTTCKATAARAFLTCTTFNMGFKLPEFWGIEVSTRANLYSTTAPSSCWSLILNSRCSCHRRRPFNVP